MSDLRIRLGALAGPPLPPPVAIVEADVARGRRALRRHRSGRIATGSGLAVAAVLAAALALPDAFTGAFTGEDAGPAAIGSGQSGVATQLVAYTGTQPAGFTLDRVPAGWEIQGVDKYGLTLAPGAAADTDPREFAGKIAIFLQRAVPDVPRKIVRVGGEPAVLATMRNDKDGRTLFVRKAESAYLTIQVWDGLGWGENEIVQFATGVHVNDIAGFTTG